MNTMLRKMFFILINIFLLMGNASGSLPGGRPLGEYYIDAEFQPEGNLVRGVERVVWRNGTDYPAMELKMHLYMNAWR
jgi:hypothetical protein